jgi:hypothetical protein
VTFGGFSVPDGPIVEIESWEATAGTTKTVYLPPTGTTGPSTITVRIPPGVADNTLLRLPGAAPAAPGMPPGDLLVRVRVKGTTPLPVTPMSAPPAYPTSAPPVFPTSAPPGFPMSAPPTSAPPGAYPPGPYPPPGPYAPTPGFPPPPAPSSGGGKRVALIVGAVVVVLLAACGVGVYALTASKGKPTASASTGSGSSPAASSSPSPTPVSEAAYQQALTGLDSAVAPGFQKLRAARNPTAVSDATAIISAGLSEQIQALRAIAPPAAVSSAHSTFVDALTLLASDVQSAGAAASSRQICGGSSALATISQSPGANQARAAAKDLSTTDAANPYKVGSWLPATTAQQTRRAGNGTYIKSPARRGSGKLKIQNGGSVDAVITLAPSGGKASLTVYVRAKGSFTAGRITDGTYGIYVATGSDWDSGAKAFTRDCDYSKFDTPATYRTTSSTYTQYSITLTPVSGGNATTSGVDPSQFPS